jgi:hypothetical protein
LAVEFPANVGIWQVSTPKLTAINDRFRSMRFLLRLASHGDDTITDYEARTQWASKAFTL